MDLKPGIPVYGAAFDARDDALFAVGGGGPSKTGVKNAIVPFLHYMLNVVLVADPATSDTVRLAAKGRRK